LEKALEGVKDYFTATLADELLQIEIEVGEEVPAYKAMDTFYLRYTDYPRIEILPFDSVVDYLGEDAPYDEGWDYHNVDIVISYANQDIKMVQYTLLRYRDALRRITKVDNTYGGRFNRVRLKTAAYSDVYQSQKDGKLVQQLIQGIEVRVLL
jgi:hypothetical protein